MKKTICGLWVLLGVLLTIGLSSAVSPAPELLARIQNGTVPTPYYLAHHQELRAQGYDNPSYRKNYRNSTDELDTVNFRAIVLLVDFSDHPHSVNAGFFDTLLFGGAFGTVKHYYNEISHGTFRFTTNNNPSVIGWLRLPQTYAYYTNNQNGLGAYPHNAARMVEDAVRIADSLIDFRQYDIDGDGYVDGLVVAHSGPGGELTGSTADIWSHMGSTNSTINVDSVRIRNYSTEPEYWETARDMTCGVYCHELGHLMFGLPDLYDIDYTSSGLGNWCLMAGGEWGGTLGNRPTYPSGWCRYIMGFVTPTNVTTALINDTIRSAETTPTLYRLAANGSTTSNEYFLVENRQQTSYDVSIPSNGLLIYHIDESVNTENSAEWYPGHTSNGHYLDALEQADGLWNLERARGVSGDAGDPYPGSTVNRYFTGSTTPDSRSYTGAATRVEVSNISNSGTAMTATLRVDGAALTMQSPNGFETWAIGATDTVKWLSRGISGNKILKINRNYPSGNWDSSSTNAANDSFFVWLVAGDTTQHARFRIRSLTMTPQVFGMSANDFTITSPSITITRPNGGEQFLIGEVHGIFWTPVGITGNVTIEINRAYPSGSWDTIATNISSESPYHWDYPGPATNQARIRIRTLNMATVVGDTSDSNFTIYSDGVTTSTIAPNQFALSEVYPNPFNASATIRFSLPQSGIVELRVFDVNGREVTTLTKSSYRAGMHSVSFDGRSLASGLYFIKLSAGKNIAVKKMMLVK